MIDFGQNLRAVFQPCVEPRIQHEAVLPVAWIRYATGGREPVMQRLFTIRTKLHGSLAFANNKLAAIDNLRGGSLQPLPVAREAVMIGKGPQNTALVTRVNRPKP